VGSLCQKTEASWSCVVAMCVCVGVVRVEWRRRMPRPRAMLMLECSLHKTRRFSKIERRDSAKVPNPRSPLSCALVEYESCRGQRAGRQSNGNRRQRAANLAKEREVTRVAHLNCAIAGVRAILQNRANPCDLYSQLVTLALLCGNLHRCGGRADVAKRRTLCQLDP